jgi:hypothetical protein
LHLSPNGPTRTGKDNCAHASTMNGVVHSKFWNNGFMHRSVHKVHGVRKVQ